MQEQMLMDLTSGLREAIDNLQITWSNKKDEILQPHLDQVGSSVQETIATVEAALRKEERFVDQGQNNSRLPPRPTSGNPPDRPDRLDNTLRPAGNMTWHHTTSMINR